MPFGRSLSQLERIVGAHTDGCILIPRVGTGCRAEDVQALLDAKPPVPLDDVHFFDTESGANTIRHCVVNLRNPIEAHRVAMEKHGSFLFAQRADVLWLGDYNFTREK